jgi:hypothetical protein
MVSDDVFYRRFAPLAHGFHAAASNCARKIIDLCEK